MNILFITKQFSYPLNSGHCMRSWPCLRGAAQAGRIIVLCFGEANDANKEGVRYIEEECGGKVIFIPKENEVSAGIAGRLLSLFHPLPFAIKMRVSAQLKARIIAVIQQHRIDTLICDGIHLALNIPFNVKCKKILNEHNIESIILERYGDIESNILKRMYVALEHKKFVRFEEKMWKQFDDIHVCSQVDLDLLKQRTGHQKLVVIPNGIQCLDQIPLNQDFTERKIVYSGLIGWKPNEDAVLYFADQIYPLLKKGRASYQWSVVGKNPTAQVKALGEKDSTIDVTGTVPEVTPYIEKSHVVIVPLRIGSGTRLKILEAMAMGRPVVSTSIGCEGLNVTHKENILIADDPQSFAQAIERLYEDAALRAHIITNARQLVLSTYDWPIIERQVGQCL